MGDGNLRFVAGLAGHDGIAYHAARHESAAICMARGYGHASGRLGVATVTEGPGVTNALTALVEAVRARQPVLVIAGDTPTRMRRHNQDIDQPAVLTSLGIGVEKLRAPETFAEDLYRAAETALRERTAVVMSVPTDWQEADLRLTGPLASSHFHTSRPSDAALDSCLDLLSGSRRPILLAGRGVVDQECADLLIAVAERIGALLLTSLVAKGTFCGDPFDLGVSGGMASHLASELAAQADLVLVVGCSLTPWTTKAGLMFSEGAAVIQCDISAAALAETQASLGILSDAKEFARSLLGQLEANGIRMEGFRTEAVRRRIASWTPAIGNECTETTVDPRPLTVELDRLIPMDRTIVQDGGHFSGWAPTLMRVPDQRGFDWGQSYMSVGLGIGAAIGAAIARPDRRTVLVAGDGGLMMSIGDLETVTRLGLPLLVVVYNDSAYGAEIGILEALELPTTHAYFTDFDLATTAKSFGFEAYTISSLDDLIVAADEVADRHTRILLDCKVNPSVRGDWFVEAFGRESWLERLSAVESLR